VARMWKLADQARAELLAIFKPQEREQLVELMERLHTHLCDLTHESGRAEPRLPRALEPNARAK
jgi:hypothetical protein